MLDMATSLRGRDRLHVHRASVRASVDAWHVRDRILARYLEGWAEADPAKIADATAEDFDFHDPLVGRFSRRTLPQYFALLRSRFGIAGVAAKRDLAFTLRGPMSSAFHAARRQYWREAPLLGLTGVSEISARHEGVTAEAVAYDLNLASETLRGCGPQLP